MRAPMWVLLLCAAAGAQPAGDRTLAGLSAPGRIVWSQNRVPHIYAENDRDAMLLMGYAQARDRFFQMDYGRRQFSGTAAELLGRPALQADVLLRTLGLRRAAEASLAAYSPQARALVEAYSAGVNAWLQDAANPLPPEYGALELTRAGIPAWTPLDTITIAKGIVFGLSFDQDMELTVALDAYQKAGQAGGFDGTALFFQDLYRSAPFDATVAIPGFFTRPQAPVKSPRNALVESARKLPEIIRPETVELARGYLEKLRAVPLLRAADLGSNWWVVHGSKTDTGSAMLANDPHLSLSIPAVWYEVHLSVRDDPERGPMNVAGVSFPGTPGVTLGCNDRVCWGATVNPMDVTDTFQERAVIDLSTLTPRATLFGDSQEPVKVIPQTYRVNQPGNGRPDDLIEAPVGPTEGAFTVILPRRNNGPVVAFDIRNPFNITALSIQYTGWGPTRELEAFLGFGRARNLDDFRKALRRFSFGSQNFSYADVDGNIAYFASAELPLREDLEKLGRVDGVPPFLIRDGTHRYHNEWLPVENQQPGQATPYEILPFAEMPQVINPAQGFIVSANNDPVGTTLANDPLGRKRATGGIYYLNPGYDGGFRAGRITGLIRDTLAVHGKITLDDMARFQTNHQMLDAEVFTPHILAAFRNASAAGAVDTGVAEAVARLADWDFSTPTGIREGFDPGDDAANLAEPGEREILASIAATIYSAWRGQFVRNTIDATLGRLGLGNNLPPNDQSLAALRRLLEQFPTTRGRGTSGVNFFESPGAASPEAARDRLILKSLRDALDLVAGSALAAAFNNSTDQNEYRWGRLHRIVLRHPMGGAFNVPPAGSFASPGPAQPGLARSGGFGTVDASNHGVRAAGLNSFMFASGPSRRFVAELAPEGIRAFQSIPGGQSGVVTDPAYTNFLGEWLTNGYHPLPLTTDQVNAEQATEERFTPAP